MDNDMNQITIKATNSRGETSVRTLTFGIDDEDKYVGKRSLQVFLNNLKNLFETKIDVDTKLETLKAEVKNDLLNGAGEAYDTLKELGDLIDENVDAIEALEAVATGKADKVHNHEEYVSVVEQTLTDNQKEQARTNIGVAQADWSIIDETNPAFIKNKPEFTADDATQVLMEIGMIDPVTDVDGSVFTDENDNIFSL